MATEKRFINDIDNGRLIDTKGELSTIDYSDAVDFYELWEFLNKLNDENEQLKQFKEKIFTSIEKEIARDEKTIEWKKETLDLLNELNDVNKQLKQQNEFLKRRCNEYWEEAGLNSDYFE